MRHLPGGSGGREPVGAHLAEQAQQFLLAVGWQVLPAGFAQRRSRRQAWAGAGVKESDMVRILRACGTLGTSGPVRARPTGTQPRCLLYRSRQRVRRVMVFVGSVLSLPKQDSRNALS